MRTITVSDGTQIDTFETFDEALQAALSEAEPGSIVALHEEHCRMSEDDFAGGDEACTCEALELIVGAQA